MHAKDIKHLAIENRVFFLDGSDFYWLDEVRNYFISLIKEDIDVNVKVYPKIDSLADIIYPLSSFGFNDDMQLIYVSDNDYKGNKDELSMLRQAIVEDITPYILVFENCKFLTTKEKKLMTVIDCNKLQWGDLTSIIEEFFAPYKGIERNAIKLIIDYTNNEMAKIHLEMKKLLDYSDGERVTADMVEDLVSDNSSLQIYNFVNNITSRNVTLAVKNLERLLGRGEAKSHILASLVNQYRRILHCAISPRSDEELSKLFGVKVMAISITRRLAIKSQVEIKNTLDMLVEYEFKFKSGQMTEAVAFDTAISKLFAS